MEKRMKGIIDMHIHSAPDVRKRRLDDLQLMEAGTAFGCRAMVIKSHLVPTMNRAALVNRIRQEKYPDSEFELFGSIALNQSVGGLNPFAVEAALKLGAKVVWLPTNTASNHLRQSGKAGGIEVVQNGKAADELKSIFELIKDHHAVLATGHISPYECFCVAEEARNAGVEKIVITHPEFHIVGMSAEEQKRIVDDYGVYLEMVYAQPMGGGVYKKNLPDNVNAMKWIGCDHIIVSTDSGQLENPPWYESYPEYLEYLSEHGLTEKEIEQMTKINPAYMLDIG